MEFIYKLPKSCFIYSTTKTQMVNMVYQTQLHNVNNLYHNMNVCLN